MDQRVDSSSNSDIPGQPAPAAALPALQVRRPTLQFEAAARTWTPAAPELTAVANSISLAMPYVEPYVVASVRAVLPRLEPTLAARARDYASQEAAHHRIHRRFNVTLRRVTRGVTRLERLLDWTFTRFGRCSDEFNVAFAAGFETVAFAAARWVDPRVDRLFAGADPVPTELFLWHLAEEAEHKGVAFDVMRGLGVKRRTYALGLALSLLMLTFFSFLGTVLFLARQHRIWNPASWIRLFIWSVSFLFLVLPMCVQSLGRDHHPDDFAEPTSLPWWLARFDPETGRLPAWDDV